MSGEQVIGKHQCDHSFTHRSSSLSSEIFSRIRKEPRTGRRKFIQLTVETHRLMLALRRERQTINLSG